MSASIPNPCCLTVCGNKNYDYPEDHGFALFTVKIPVGKWVKMFLNGISALNAEYMSRHK